MNTVEFEGRVYEMRHGGPFDRGAADSYYGRGIKPHYYIGATATSTKVERRNMTDAEVKEYYDGFYWNEWVNRDFKDWN